MEQKTAKNKNIPFPLTMFLMFLQLRMAGTVPAGHRQPAHGAGTTWEKSCESVTQTMIHEVCLKSLFSCRGACYQTPGHGPRTCGCDPLCPLYDDCCHDLEAWCPLLVKYRAKATEKGLVSTCLDNGERVIYGCKDYQDPVPTQISRFPRFCTRRAHQYLNESVMNHCTIFKFPTSQSNSGAGSLNSCTIWDNVLPSKEELDLNGIKQKLQQYENHWKRPKDSLQTSFYTPRLCHHHAVSLHGLLLTRQHNCQDYLWQQYSLQCGAENTNEGSVRSFQIDLTELSKFPTTATLPNTSSSLFQPLDKDQIFYIFEMNIEYKFASFKISSKNTPHTTQFWEEITCIAGLKFFTEIEKHNTVDKSEFACTLTKCMFGYFFTRSKCLKPTVLTIIVTVSQNNLFEEQNGILSSIESGLKQQRTFRLRCLRRMNETANEDLVLTYHYTITGVLQEDDQKSLKVSHLIHSELVKSFHEDGNQDSPNISLCIHFSADDTSLVKRCDEISFSVVESTHTNYTIVGDTSHYSNISTTSTTSVTFQNDDHDSKSEINSSTVSIKENAFSNSRDDSLNCPAFEMTYSNSTTDNTGSKVMDMTTSRSGDHGTDKITDNIGSKVSNTTYLNPITSSPKKDKTYSHSTTDRSADGQARESHLQAPTRNRDRNLAPFHTVLIGLVCAAIRIKA